MGDDDGAAEPVVRGAAEEGIDTRAELATHDGAGRLRRSPVAPGNRRRGGNAPGNPAESHASRWPWRSRGARVATRSERSRDERDGPWDKCHQAASWEASWELAGC